VQRARSSTGFSRLACPVNASELGRSPLPCARSAPFFISFKPVRVPSLGSSVTPLALDHLRCRKRRRRRWEDGHDLEGGAAPIWTLEHPNEGLNRAGSEPGKGAALLEILNTLVSVQLHSDNPDSVLALPLNVDPFSRLRALRSRRSLLRSHGVGRAKDDSGEGGSCSFPAARPVRVQQESQPLPVCMLGAGFSDRFLARALVPDIRKLLGLLHISTRPPTRFGTIHYYKTHRLREARIAETSRRGKPWGPSCQDELVGIRWYRFGIQWQ